MRHEIPQTLFPSIQDATPEPSLLDMARSLAQSKYAQETYNRLR
jgi:hypothetical protein